MRLHAYSKRALAALVALAALTGLAGCTSESAPPSASRPAPPIDLKVPERLETAVFAVG